MKFSSVDFLMGNKWRRSGAKLYSSSTIFTFVPFPASPLWMLTYFRDMIDLKFRQHLLLHIWKIIRHYCIAEKSWCSPFKIKRHNGLKFSTIFGAKIQIFCWNEFWCFEPIFKEFISWMSVEGLTLKKGREESII